MSFTHNDLLNIYVPFVDVTDSRNEAGLASLGHRCITCSTGSLPGPTADGKSHVVLRRERVLSRDVLSIILAGYPGNRLPVWPVGFSEKCSQDHDDRDFIAGLLPVLAEDAGPIRIVDVRTRTFRMALHQLKLDRETFYGKSLERSHFRVCARTGWTAVSSMTAGTTKTTQPVTGNRDEQPRNGTTVFNTIVELIEYIVGRSSQTRGSVAGAYELPLVSVRQTTFSFAQALLRAFSIPAA